MSSKHRPKQYTTKTIEIKLEVPQFERVEKAKERSVILAKKAWRKRFVRVALALLLVAMAAVVTILLLHGSLSGSSTTSEKKLTTISDAEKRAMTPQFQTVLPADKSIETLGGWTRVSPPDRNAVFAYTDYIHDDRIVVSQQPMPDSFVGDVDQQVAELAAGYKATEKLTASGLTVYIGTSAKGPQSLIFTKNNLLILIKSSVKLSNNDWLEYITNLR